MQRQTYNVLSGALGGTYRLTPEAALAFNVGRGFRAPSIFELHAFGMHGGVAAFQIGDPNLVPEISLNTDVSVRWRSPRLLAKATLYRNAIDNYVYLVNTEAIDPYTQSPIMRATQADAVLRGADLSVRAQILPWLQLRGVFETVDGENAATGDKLPLPPATRLEAGVRYTWREWGRMQSPHLDFGARHVLRKEAAGRFEPFWQFDANPDFGVASTEAYTLLDVAVGFDLPLAQEYVHFDLRIENLLDEVYRDFLDTYKGYALSLGRNVGVMVSIPFVLR